MKYPDISDILSLQAQGRRQRAQLSLGAKLDALDALRERVRPIMVAREVRRTGHRGNFAAFFAVSPPRDTD